MVDLNAQVGVKQNNMEHIRGNFEFGKRSANGQKLVDFLMEHNLYLLNSLFRKKTSNKWTWSSPNGKSKNEIDYIASNHPKAFIDTSVIQNLNFNTDHQLIGSKLRMIPPKASRKYIKKTPDRTIDPKCKELAQSLSENIYDLINDNTNIKESYQKLEEYLTAPKQINPRKQNHPLSEKTLHLIEEKKKLIGPYKKNNLKLIAETSKKIKENIRRDRKIRRLQTFEKHIMKSGGVRKAFKELREINKEWIPKVKRGANTVTKREDISS